jgi:type VI secretion system protein ImpH
MANETRPSPMAVKLLTDLRQNPYCFGFFPVMRRLEAAYSERARFGRSTRPSEDGVRLGQQPTLAFAPSTLAAVESEREVGTWRLLVHFFGLFGPQGPLPSHLTEYARDRSRNAGDHAFCRFADLFHHRLLSLFYRAWADAEPVTHADRPKEDRFAFYVSAVCGYAGREDIDRVVRGFAGHYACQTRHAEGLSSIISKALGLPVEIQQFYGHWMEIPDGLRLRLSGSNTAGGLGARVWDCQSRFRITFGPLTMSQYQRLLLDRSDLPRLINIVRPYVGEQFIWDVALVLSCDETPPLRLDSSTRLGWTTWLGNRAPAVVSVRLDPESELQKVREEMA